MDQQNIEQTISDVENSNLPEDIKAILGYAKKITLEPSSITQSDLEPIVASGDSDDVIIDVVEVCSIANFMNRFIEGLGVDITEEQANAAGKVFPSIGYDKMAAAFAK